MARPRKSAITVSNRGEAVKTANVALARRLASGRVQGGGSRTIPLKEPQRWHTYIANTFATESAFHDMREGGWVPLLPEDLACPIDESGFRLSEDGYLVRGEKGREMIFKMDAADYKLLEAAKTRHNMQGIGSAKKVREDIANAAAGPLGSEAADFLHNMPGQVLDTIVSGE